MQVIFLNLTRQIVPKYEFPELYRHRLLATTFVTSCVSLAVTAPSSQTTIQIEACSCFEAYHVAARKDKTITSVELSRAAAKSREAIEATGFAAVDETHRGYSRARHITAETG